MKKVSVPQVRLNWLKRSQKIILWGRGIWSKINSIITCHKSQFLGLIEFEARRISNSNPLMIIVVFFEYINLRFFKQGIMFVNDHNIGRYWPSTGSQVTLFIPGSFLYPSPQKNHIVIVETESTPKELSLSFVDKPYLDKIPPTIGNWGNIPGSITFVLIFHSSHKLLFSYLHFFTQNCDFLRDTFARVWVQLDFSTEICKFVYSFTKN